jgi:hypothetical protein
LVRIRSPVWASIIAQYRSGITLAVRIVALTIVVTLPVGGSVTNAEAIRRSAFNAGGPAAQASARAVDLASLKAKAAALTTTGMTIYERAGGILDRLAKSGFPDDELRAETVITLREVAKLSYHLSATSEVLGDAVQAASTGQIAESGALTQALEEFGAAAREFDRSADELLKQVRVVHAQEQTRASLADKIAHLEVDVPKTEPEQSAISRLQVLERTVIAEERAELRALIDATRPYEAAQKAITAAISELAPLLAPVVTRQTPEPGISLSVYGFFDQQGAEQEGYGLYTYVLLAEGPSTSRRNVAFLRDLLASTRRSDREVAAVRRQLNIFYLPSQNRIQALVIARSSADPAAAIAAPGVYHYQQAERLLVRLCTESAASHPKLCASAWRGPYLLTVAEPVSASATLSPTRLLVDLSDIHERAFGEFISAIKEQVTRPDFTDRQKVDSLRLRILDITLKAADWLDPIKEGIAEIVFLNDATAK